MNFLLPEIYKINGELEDEKLSLVPYIMNYANGKISIKEDSYQDPEFNMSVFISKEIEKYT
jgi:hypothetical protein